jgi:hypothetical protein
LFSFGTACQKIVTRSWLADLVTKSPYQIASDIARKQIYRQWRRRRGAKHGSAWHSGNGPVSMLSCTTRLVGMTRGLYGHGPVGT